MICSTSLSTDCRCPRRAAKCGLRRTRRGGSGNSPRTLRGRPPGAAGRRPARVDERGRTGRRARPTAPSRVDSRAVLRVNEGAAAGRDDDVARRAAAPGARRAPTARKYGSPCSAKMSATAARSRCSISSSMSSTRQSEAARQRACHRGLAGAHEADQVDLVGLHAHAADCECLEEARDTRWRPRRHPRCVDGAVGAERRNRERHGQPVVAAGVGDAARGGAAPVDHEAVGSSSTSTPRARKPVTSALMRSLSFTRSSPAPVTSSSPPNVASAASAGSSSISPGTSSGAIRTSATAVAVADPNRAAAARRPASSSASTSTSRAGAAQDVEERGPGGVQADVPQSRSSEPGRPAAATIQKAADEKSPGTRTSPARSALAAAT